MKKIALFLFYLFFFLAALLFFTPKESLYYFGEKQLKPLGVVIGHEEVIDHGFTLEVQHAKLYVKKIESAKIQSIQLHLFGLYNALDISDIVLDKTFEQFFPPRIDHVDIRQSILSPVVLSAEAVGDFGEAIAVIDLLDRNGSILLTPSKLMRSRYKNTLRQLKRTKEGDYSYVFKF